MTIQSVLPAVRGRGRLLGSVAAILLALSGAADRVEANGWEHGAVPLDALVRALSFDSPVIRERAAQSLGYRRQDEAVEPLLDRLDAPEPDPWVRRAIYQALGGIGAPRATGDLARCLDKEQLVPLRAACVEALGGIGTDEALTKILDVLNGDPDTTVRAAAVQALGEFPSPEAADTLAALLDAADDPELRRRAIRALGRNGSDIAVEPLLAALEKAETNAMRLVVVRGLTDIGSPRATPALTAVLDKADDPRLRAAVAAALGASRDGDARGALLAMLEDPVPAVRYMAVEGLERLGASEAAPALAAVAEREAAELSGRDVDQWVERPLETVAALSLQARALRAAVALDPDAAKSALLAAARPAHVPRTSSRALDVANGVYHLRRAALYGLGYIEAGPAVVDRLSGPAGVEDPDPRLRAVAARSLGVLNPPGAGDIIRPLLCDPSAEVRMTAARVLGRLGSKDAVPALADALSDSWTLVREEAALALGYIGDPDAAPALRQAATRDESRAVRAAADYALSLLSDGG